MTYLGMVIIVGACLMIILPSFVVGINNLFTEMTGYLNRPAQWLSEIPLQTPYTDEIVSFIQNNFENLTQNLMAVLNGLSSSLLTSIIEMTSHLFDMIFGITISVYLILDQERAMASFEQGLSVHFPKWAPKINYYVRYVYHTFQDYIIGRLLDSFIIGIIAYIGFLIFGATIPILMSFLISSIQAVWVALFILLLQQLDGNEIGPKIMGDRVGLSPLWVISSVILGGALFGFIGFFLVVLVAAVLKEIYDQALLE